MRNYQKKQCLETLSLLHEAHAEAARYMDRAQAAEAALLLEQCQQAAVGMGTMIDSVEGEGTKTVRSLEGYCELVYRIHGSITSGYPVQPWQMEDNLRKSLARVEQGLRHEINTRLETVFLPYKASMWDSLESVWRAAQEDPLCDAFVIPVPYYDRKPDGSFGKLHYELDQFPVDVPVIEYDTYDFEKRHPDIIFIHNPYDDGNYVTSVPPFFYSKNLRQYTDKLVYIPYFVLGDIDPADQEAVGKMEHFCMADGVINADYVVVQSEKMREVYVDVLTRHTGESRRMYWEKKILGLGSPKVDRVCGLRREDFVLPDSWERLIFREDGSRKKVVFYNTSVNILLKYGGAMLEKIRKNFRIFQENIDSAVLLWRPHPLSEATLASMRPQLLAEYEKMVGEYRAAGWGIYDDSPNVDRAIAVSDAYYGDGSSLVWLYQKTGKPIVIQNVNVDGSAGDGKAF